MYTGIVHIQNKRSRGRWVICVAVPMIMSRWIHAMDFRFLQRKNRPVLLSMVVLFFLIGVDDRSVHAQKDQESIRIGMSAAFTGPASALGNSVRLGIEAHFDEVNLGGGVHQRKLELITLDDAYEPNKTAPNMRRLIETESVFAVIGNVGTPTASVAVPIANEKRVPMFGAFTGAGLLRKSPPDRYIINFRASYAEETAEMVRGLTQEMGIEPKEIGFFTQNDAYGDAGWNGAIAALEKMGFSDAKELPHGRYTRNTIDVEEGLSRLLDPRFDVKSVIMIGAYKPCAQFIHLAKSLDFNPVFINVSFVGSDALLQELGSDGDGVVVTQVVPSPRGDFQAAVDFRKALPTELQNFVSFEGYLAAKSFVEALRLAGPGSTQEQLIHAIESATPIDLGMGMQHQLSPTEHQFSHGVWPTVIRNGTFSPVEHWGELTKRENLP